MIIGGIKHREQRFNSRSAGVSSALLFISIGGMCFIELLVCHVISGLILKSFRSAETLFFNATIYKQKEDTHVYLLLGY